MKKRIVALLIASIAFVGALSAKTTVESHTLEGSVQSSTHQG